MRDLTQGPDGLGPGDIPLEDHPLRAEYEERLRGKLCIKCGAGGARDYRYMRVMSFFVMTQHRTWDEFLCRNCAASRGIREHTLSAVVGWWGFPFGVLTFGALFINAWTLMRTTWLGRVAALAVPGAILVLLAGIFAGGASLSDKTPKNVEREFVDRETKRLYDAGAEQISRNDLDAARESLQSAHELSPDSWVVEHALAGLHLRRGETAACIKHARAVDERLRGHGDSRALIAIACEWEGRYFDALQAWTNAVSADDSPSHHLARQNCARRCNRLHVYRKSYARRFEKNPESEVDRYLHARILADPLKRKPILEELLNSETFGLSVRKDLIETLLELRDPKAALALGDDLPRDIADDRGFSLLARCHIEDSNPNRALDVLDGIIDLHPTNLLLYAQRSGYRQLAGRLDKVREDLTLMAAPPFEAEWAVIELAVSQGLENQPEAGIAALREIDIAPSNLSSELQRQIPLLRFIWRKTGAEAVLRETTVSSTERDHEVAMASVRLTRALCLLEAKRDAEARVELEKLKSMKGHDLQIGAGTARLFLGEMSPEEYRRSMRNQGRSFDNNIEFNIGLFHELAGRTPDARQAYEAAVERSLGCDYPVDFARQRLASLER